MSGVILGKVVGVNVKLGYPTVVTNILTPSSQVPSFVIENNFKSDIFIYKTKIVVMSWGRS